MKNLTLACLLILASLSSCKKEDTKNNIPEPEVTDRTCIALEDIPNLKVPTEMATYLKSNYKDFCDKPTWWKVVYRSHQITKAAFDTAVADATASNDGASDYTAKSWADINAIFKDIPEDEIYSTYITFKPDTNNSSVLALEPVDTFKIEPSCYSVALFKGIAQKFGNEVNTMTFKFIELRNIKQVYFQVVDKDGVTAIYCNISTDPTK